MHKPLRFILSAQVVLLLAASASYAIAGDNISVLLNTAAPDAGSSVAGDGTAYPKSHDFTATPDPFSFVDRTDVERSTQIVSAPVTITGLSGAAPISVSEGKYSIGCSNKFTSNSGTINNGQTVCVRHTSSGNFATATDTILTVGTVSDTFTSTTLAQDLEPNSFTFTDVTEAPLSSPQTSNTIAIGGYDEAAPISVSGGEYSIGCTGTFSSAAGAISNGETVCVRHTSSANFATATDTILTVGSVSDTFTSTTLAQDLEPNSFTFIDVTEAPLSSLQTSNTIAIGGYDEAAPISVSGGEYSIGCTDTFTSAPGTISNGETVCVRHTSSASFSTPTDTTLTVGAVSDTFTSITLTENLEPAPFTFTDAINVPLNLTQTSNPITIGGYDGAAPISVSGGEYSIGCTGTFTSAPGTISNGEMVCVRHISSASPSTATDTILTIGSVSHTFTSVTLAPLDPYHAAGSLGLWDGLLGLLVALGYGYRQRSDSKSCGNSPGAAGRFTRWSKPD